MGDVRRRKVLECNDLSVAAVRTLVKLIGSKVKCGLPQRILNGAYRLAHRFELKHCAHSNSQLELYCGRDWPSNIPLIVQLLESRFDSDLEDADLVFIGSRWDGEVVRARVVADKER